MYEIESIIPVVIKLGDQHITNKLGNIDIVGEQPPDEIITTSDLCISEGLLTAVRDRFPLSFTEESLKVDQKQSQQERRKTGYRWEIDPIDGSLDLQARDEEIRRELVPAEGCSLKGSSGTILGLLDENNIPVAMVGYTPETQTLIYCTKDSGPYVKINGVLQAPAEPIDKIVGVQRTVVRLKRLQDFYEFLAEKEKKELVIVEGGGPGAMASRIVTEGINLYINSIASNWKEWDTIGIHLITQMQGGEITDLFGNQLLYNQRDPRKHYGMITSLTGHLGISHNRLIGRIEEFAERYGQPLLEPDKREGASIYEHYRECISNRTFLS